MSEYTTELETLVETLRDQNRVLREAMEDAHSHVCSLLCLNAKKEGKPWMEAEWIHVEACEKIQNALAKTGG